ncbi:uncharacterized protein LOC133323614, partial [Musca vetustissima]|uniref:uncharacterized protein LOC133323614 n=1 Tax=Musca vetustissima TaxID=27455 RepID=UPI002AB7AE64
MQAFRWGLVGVALLVVACANAATIGSSNDENVEFIDDIQRLKRSNRGYMRGQTQSQYLNFGKPEQDGKAEAEANESGSRSTVSGSHGMGQAQSQFSVGDCGECGGSNVYDYNAGSPDPLIYGGGAGAYQPTTTYTDGTPSTLIGRPGVGQYDTQ